MNTVTITPKTVPAGVESPAGTGGHDIVEIYERCGCDPDDIDFHPTHFAIDGVGVTCARGLLYLVCAQCCCDSNRHGCEDTHVHGYGRPACPAGAIGTGAAATSPPVGDSCFPAAHDQRGPRVR